MIIRLTTLAILFAVALAIFPAHALTEAEKLQLRPPTTTRLPIAGAVDPQDRIKLTPKYRVSKPDVIRATDGVVPDHIVLKFIDGARIRATNPRDLNTYSKDPRIIDQRLDGLIARLDRLDAYDRHLLDRRQIDPARIEQEMAAIRDVLKAAPLAGWGKMYALSDSYLDRVRLNADLYWQRQTADLAGYYWIALSDAKVGEDLVNRLNAFDVVEEVHFHPVGQAAQDIPPATTDLSRRQGYLNAAPRGIGAAALWGNVPGARGENVAVIDIEEDWVVGHEDLPVLSPVDGVVNGGDNAQHGTAALSIMVAGNNGFGVTGIVHAARAGVVSIQRNIPYDYIVNMADAIMFAANSLRVGDVILLEWQFRTPLLSNATCHCGSDSGDCGLVPVEYWNVVFDAISAATAMGVIVVEAAANGYQDLDKPRYDNRFNRSHRNSGAIMVGASGPNRDRRALCFSNTGSRLDLHAWGRRVMAAGYGESGGNVDATLRFGTPASDDRQWYRSDYNGTSSASPIVAGAVGVIQSILVERGYRPMDWIEVRDLLATTGTPQTPGDDVNRALGNIGPMPDLQAAVAALNVTHPAPPTNGPLLAETVSDEIEFQADEVVIPTVAGVTGTRTRRLSFAVGQAAIGRLEYGERRDRPCFLRVERMDFNTNLPNGDERVRSTCGNRGVVPRSRKSVPPRRMVTGRPWTEVMTGVQVCNSSSRNRFYRMKGVRMYYARVRPDGTLNRNDPTPFEHDRPRCDGDWGPIVQCAPNAVVTGIIAHERRDRDDTFAFTGLQIMCRPIGR